MIFWPFCAFIWFKNIEKMLLQMTSGFLQLESTLGTSISVEHNIFAISLMLLFYGKNNLWCYLDCV
jgi:hypothetical protein